MRNGLLVIAVLLLSACLTNDPDQYARGYNFSYVPAVYGVTLDYTNASSDFAKGDAALIEARINGTDPRIAIPYYKKAVRNATLEEQALLYETIASISGNRWYYWRSHRIWKRLGNEFRAEMDWNLFLGRDPPYQFNDYDVQEPYLATPKGTTTVTIGESYFTMNESDVLVSQVDRVTRDWLSSQLQDPTAETLLTVFSEGYDVEGIGWHEGGRITQYHELLNFTHIPVTGTIVRQINGTWYAPNENGTFMFEVPVDKIQYPTTRFFHENLAMIIDTHGVNMLVEQALRNNATVVMGCCDHIGKVKAALYLNERGVKVICNTDKYLPRALGKTNLTIGSAPFHFIGNEILFGYQPVTINISEPIIVLNATEEYGISYYATPTIYFLTLKEKTTLPFDLRFVTIDDYGQMDTVVEAAHRKNAHVIAVRVYTEDDYRVISEWLEESPENRVILFHSEAYPYGYLLLRVYPLQVTFGDLAPDFR